MKKNLDTDVESPVKLATEILKLIQTTENPQILDSKIKEILEKLAIENSYNLDTHPSLIQINSLCHEAFQAEYNDQRTPLYYELQILANEKRLSLDSSVLLDIVEQLRVKSRAMNALKEDRENIQ